MDRRKKRGLESSTKLNGIHFAVVLTIGTCITAEPYVLKQSGKEIEEQIKLFEIARMLVRLDHVASYIVNANHRIM